jgi:hypothetical protein
MSYISSVVLAAWVVRGTVVDVVVVVVVGTLTTTENVSDAWAP